ncbi:tetratricopeptide repeat protein [Rhodoblastus sp.]|uniref:tetratricopeptide repeat protein n=1 Tax=Rhodoblastus sp. TaxID=1962975 RepID=UPI003F953F86
MGVEQKPETFFDRAVALARRGDNEAAKAAYIEALRRDPTHFGALNDLACLLHGEGRLSAARLAYAQAVALHPDHPAGRINFGNFLLEADDAAGAEIHYRAALAAAPDLPQAHQGLARVLAAHGEEAAEHWRKGFGGRNAVHRRRYRGSGEGVPVLLLVSARLGNVATRRWLDDRDFAVTEIFAEFVDFKQRLPEHRLLINAIGDADLCAADLDKAGGLRARSTAPEINDPGRVRATRREDNDRRLSLVPGVRTARARRFSKPALLAEKSLDFPLLRRAPGFHTGRHFARVEARADLPEALARPPDGDVLVLENLDARGPDGFFRKFRVMFVDGKIYPLHLAVSRHWLVHYFSSDMAENAEFRAEEQRFLEAMPEALGPKAFAALQAVERELGLDYGGVDFGLAPDGALLLFEANATMNVFPPDGDPKWDYRRPAAEAILRAARDMTKARAGVPQGGALRQQARPLDLREAAGLQTGQAGNPPRRHEDDFAQAHRLRQ